MSSHTQSQAAHLEALRTEVLKAVDREKADGTISGKLELPDADALVVVRFNYDAYVEFAPEAIAPNSITAFTRKELREVIKRVEERALGVEQWFHLKLKHGSTCILHYKTVAVKFVLDRSVQKPFYIDTDELKCVYIEPRPSEHGHKLKQISCDEYSEDRSNKEVFFYYKHPCCCTNNELPTYGYVSCDDGWRDPRCF